MTDLLTMADALDRLADAATPGPWETRNLGRHDLSAVTQVYFDGPVLANCGPTPRAAADARLMAQAPSLARSVAAMLRMVAAEHPNSQGTVVTAVLAAVEPLLPMLGTGALATQHRGS